MFNWLNPYDMNKYQNGADGWTGWESKRDLWHQLKRKSHFSGGASYYILIKYSERALMNHSQEDQECVLRKQIGSILIHVDFNEISGLVCVY